MPDNDKPQNRLVRFFSNPLVGGLGTIIGLISILLAIYFYSEQREFRKLTYYVHPVKAAVVKADQASELTAIYAGKAIRTDITATQIALWNQGKLSIKSSNILKPVVLYTGNKAPILEATLRKVSRDVSKIQLQTDDAQNGRISISWQILEQDDGGIIQLIYAGSPEVDIRCSGVIEGQKEIEQVIYKQKIQSPEEQYSSTVKTGHSFFLLVMIFSVVLLSLVVIKNLIFRRPLLERKSDWVVSIAAAGLIGISVYGFFITKIVTPPFGF